MARGELFFVRDGYLIVEQTLTGPKDRLFYVPLEYQLFHEDGRPVDWPGLREIRGTRTGNIIVVGDPHTATNLEEFRIAGDATSESKDYARGFQAALADRTWHKEGQGKKHYANSQRWWDGYNEGHRAKRSTTQESRTLMARKTSPGRVVTQGDAEAAGEQYATDQIASTYFGDWVREQLLEASKLPQDTVLPLETKDDATVIAGNMLKQLETDTKRELRGEELKNLINPTGAGPGYLGVSPGEHADFFKGFRKACDGSRDWLADELLTIKGEMGGDRVEARCDTPAAEPTTLIIDGGLEARLLKTGGPSKTLQAKTETWVVHHAGEPGSPVLQVDIFKPNGKPWAAWTGNFTQASKREIANKVAAARNGTGVGEARTVNAKRRYGNTLTKYRPGKIYKHLKVDRVVPSNGAHSVEFNDGFSVQVHGGSGRDDILYAMHPYDMRLEQRAPGPESRRDYQYAALKAVLGNKPADFVVDYDGDVQARLTAVVRETHHPKARGSARRRA